MGNSLNCCKNNEVTDLELNTEKNDNKNVKARLHTINTVNASDNENITNPNDKNNTYSEKQSASNFDTKENIDFTGAPKLVLHVSNIPINEQNNVDTNFDIDIFYYGVNGSDRNIKDGVVYFGNNDNYNIVDVNLPFQTLSDDKAM